MIIGVLMIPGDYWCYIVFLIGVIGCCLGRSDNLRVIFGVDCCSIKSNNIKVVIDVDCCLMRPDNARVVFGVIDCSV